MSEIIEIGSIFLGIGGMVVFFVGAYFLYQMSRIWKLISDKEENYDLLEEMNLMKYSKEKGFDIEKEKMKRKVFQKNKKNFRKKVEEEIYDSMFGKQKEEE